LVLYLLLQDIKLSTLAKIGDKFNPEIHEIVEIVNDESIEDETIVDIIEQGFKHKETLINYAKVKVNKQK